MAMSVLASKDRGVDSRAAHNTFIRQEELRGYQISPNSLHLSEANVNKSESSGSNTIAILLMTKTLVNLSENTPKTFLLVLTVTVGDIF